MTRNLELNVMGNHQGLIITNSYKKVVPTAIGLRAKHELTGDILDRIVSYWSV